MPRLTASDARAHQRRGATLVELLVAFTLLAIVGGALTRVLVKQQQFYRDAAETADVRRELRFGAALLPMEMRSISPGGNDISEMEEGKFAFYATIGSSVVCAKSGSTIDLPPTNLAGHTLTTWYSPPMPGDVVHVFDDGADAGAVDDAWRMYTVISVAPNTSSCVGKPFTDPLLDPPATKPRYRVTLDKSVSSTITDGSVVRITRQVRYSLFQPGASGRWYLGAQEYRNGAWGTMQPISGPYRPFVSGDNPNSGLQFRYFDIAGARLTSSGDAGKIARVDVTLRAAGAPSSLTERRGATIRDSVTFRIAVRNRTDPT